MAQRLQMDSPGAVGPAFIGGGSILALAIVVFHIKYELDTRRFKNVSHVWQIRFVSVVNLF